MLKKWLNAFSITMLVAAFTATASVSAAPFREGQHYVTLPNPVKDAPPVMEFFSFFCPHCYQFENVHHVSEEMQRFLPEGIKVTRYHVDFLGGSLGPVVTQAWAVAIAMGVEDKVKQPIFDGIQKTRTITNPSELKATFIAASGIQPEEYDASWNSFAVKALVSLQREAALDVGLRGVPSVFVKGTYLVKADGLDKTSVDTYVGQYRHVVKFLLRK